MFRPLLIGGTLCAALTAPLLHAEPAAAMQTQTAPAGQVPGWVPSPDSGSSLPSWVEQRRTELQGTAPQAPKPPEPPRAPELPSTPAGQPEQGGVPNWVIEHGSRVARPGAPAIRETPDAATVPVWAGGNAQTAPAEEATKGEITAAPPATRTDDAPPGPSEMVVPPTPGFGALPVPAYPAWGGAPYGGWGRPYHGGWNNGWTPWGGGWGGNDWMPWGSGWGNSGWGNRGWGDNWMPWGSGWGGDGWNNTYNSGYGDTWGRTWGDGVGDAEGEADFSFAMRAWMSGNLRGEGYGDGYGSGWGRAYDYQGYGPYLPPPMPMPMPMPMPTEPEGPADGDDDGVSDASDLCPDTAEGAAVDALGCDDSARIVLRGVNFKADSAELTEESLAILDGVAGTLSAHPEIKIMVAGHTDSDGEDAYNRDLSQRRAQSVVDYLGDNGVDPNNMIAKGFGEENPIAGNDTAEDKAENRRVELNRL